MCCLGERKRKVLPLPPTGHGDKKRNVSLPRPQCNATGGKKRIISLPSSQYIHIEFEGKYLMVSLHTAILYYADTSVLLENRPQCTSRGSTSGTLMAYFPQQ